MYRGMAFPIFDRERFSEYKDQFTDFLESLNEEVNVIHNATIIEYEGDEYLFIDGHDSILNWEGASDEFMTVFLYSACSDLEERAEEYTESYFNDTLLADADQLLDEHGEDIMKAVHDCVDVGPVIYVETLLDTLED